MEQVWWAKDYQPCGGALEDGEANKRKVGQVSGTGLEDDILDRNAQGVGRVKGNAAEVNTGCNALGDGMEAGAHLEAGQLASQKCWTTLEASDIGRTPLEIVGMIGEQDWRLAKVDQRLEHWAWNQQQGCRTGNQGQCSGWLMTGVLSSELLKPGMEEVTETRPGCKSA